MSALFLRILNMSITAGWLIIAVIIARQLLKAAPKWIACLLWGMVALRLICPFSVESAFSLIPSAGTIPAGIADQGRPSVDTGIALVNDAVNPVVSASFSPDPANSANPLQIIIPVAAAVWIAGIFILLAYALISYMKLRKTVAVCLPAGENVFACDEISTPFILGIFRPEIYVPSSMSGETLELVLLHENAHLQRHDHWWKPLGFLLMSVYWFNPLCWIAYVLLCRDIEMACDEKVIRKMDRTARAAYSRAILDCSFSRRRIAACPLAFGEVGVKERVKGVLHYKRPAFLLMCAAAVICLAVAACFLTDPKHEKQNQPSAEVPESSAEVPESSAAAPESFAGTPETAPVRTEYIGNAPEVAGIAQHLPYPGDYSYDHIEIQSDHEPYELTVYLNGKDDLGQSDFEEASRLAFEQIGNMGVIRFCRVKDGEVIALISRPELSDPDAQVTAGDQWQWPLEKTHVIGDSFGTRVHPVTGEERMHDHMNLRAEEGEWVFAAVGGTIKDIRYDPEMGNTVTVDAGSGIEVEYGHLAKVGVTAVGESIGTGDVIGTAGRTGTATGTNLSFKVTVDGEPVDPAGFLNFFHFP